MSLIDKELRNDIISEIEKNITDLISLFKNDLHFFKDKENINLAFRLFHSLKGNTRSIGLLSMEKICHLYEDVLLKSKNDNNFYESYYLYAKKLLIALELEIINLKEYPNSSLDITSLEIELNSILDCTSPVLLIDDEEDILEILSLKIDTLFNMKSTVFTDSVLALSVAFIRSFKFIITDYRMPKMVGTDLVRKIRSTPGPNQKTPIIILTAFNPDYESLKETWDNVFFMEKPFEESNFQYMIKCCLLISKKAS